jgi:hypothetical protein
MALLLGGIQSVGESCTRFTAHLAVVEAVLVGKFQGRQAELEGVNKGIVGIAGPHDEFGIGPFVPVWFNPRTR